MVKPVLQTMYPHRRELVPCFIGAPGIGKTQGLYEFAEEIGVNVVTFILSNTVPSEVSGIRMPDQKSKKLEVFDDSRMASLKDGDILFFDEILEAPPMLWSACLTLIQDRIMASGRKLPDVFIVAASNQVASPGIIPASVRNRFQFIELSFDSVHWCRWFRDRFGADPKEITPYIKEDSDQYNILTPREVVKLYTWMKQGDQTGDDWVTKKRIVEAMFDPVVCDKLVQIVRQRSSAQQQIADALRNSNLKTTDMPLGDFKDWSLKEIFEYLQKQDCWEDMEAILATIQFDDGMDEEEDIKY